MKDAKHTEVQEALVELIEKDELSLSQMEWMLEFFVPFLIQQGNGCIEDGEEWEWGELFTK